MSQIKPASPHHFHIPVMGIAFTVDTPIKVAPLGIDSVVSVVEDELLEKMRAKICSDFNLPFQPIPASERANKATRITAYLNLLNEVVTLRFQEIQNQEFESGPGINRYFQLLPDTSLLKMDYQRMLTTSGESKVQLQKQLRNQMTPGRIDVNIMTKVDRTAFDKQGQQLPPEFSDALMCLKGFADSNLYASVVFSAGLNPKLYSYCESFSDFFPDSKGYPSKGVILKVSDYRSALIQGRFFAKKGIWISEFRIESGINCGGHAFVSSGSLMGPILEEFKNKRQELFDTLFHECQHVLETTGKHKLSSQINQRITAQGGLGTAYECNELTSHYGLDAIGWGSPFLLVPEVTNVDEATLQDLCKAKPEDFFLSNASPLGVPFHNFRKSSSEQQRKLRIEKNRPGSPCYKKHLAFNQEFTDTPICTASRQYQKLKLETLKQSGASQEVVQKEETELLEKDCLCEGLSVSALLKNELEPPHRLTAVTICPGPNLQFFSGVFTLNQMVDHIYGRINLLNALKRPHVFINELQLYVDYFLKDVKNSLIDIQDKKQKQLEQFKENLLQGIGYYDTFFKNVNREQSFNREILFQLRDILLKQHIGIPEVV